MHSYPLLHWIKFCSSCFRQAFSFWGQKKWSLVVLDRQSSYTVPIVWELAWADSALVILDEWSSYRHGQLSRFDYTCMLTIHLNDSLPANESWIDKAKPNVGRLVILVSVISWMTSSDLLENFKNYFY